MGKIGAILGKAMKNASDHRRETIRQQHSSHKKSEKEVEEDKKKMELDFNVLIEDKIEEIKSARNMNRE